MKKLQMFYSRLTIRFKYWVLLVVASAVIVGFGYVAVQQNYRDAANDPQVQYAQDISNALEQGASPEALGGNSPVDPRKGLGLFLVVIGEDKKVLASSMQLEGANNPVPPNGTFDAAKKEQQRFTWKPAKDVRVAAVMQHYAGKKPGYILVARSLKETEKREQQLTLTALASFLALLAISTVAVRIGAGPRKPRAVAAETQSPLQFESDATDTAPEDVDEETLPVKEPSAPKAKSSKSSSKAKKSSKKSSR